MTVRQLAHFPRLYYLPHRYVGSATNFSGHLDRCQAMGFSHVLLTPPFLAAENGDVFLTADHDRLDASLNSTREVPEFLHWLAEQCRTRDLSLLLDLPLDQLAGGYPLVGELDNCFLLRRETYAHSVDPRHDVQPSGTALARFSDPQCAERLTEWWGRKLSHYLDLGLAGFRFSRPGALSPALWKDIISAASGPDARGIFIAATYGMSRDAVRMLDGCGFDYLQSSLPWWDFRSSWLVEEYEALRLIAPLIAAPEDPLGERLKIDDETPRRMRAAYERMLTLACTTGCGMIIPMGFEYGMRERYDPCQSTSADFAQAMSAAPFDLTEQIGAANNFVQQEPILQGCGNLRSLTGPNSRVTALLRRDNSETHQTDDALLILVNPDPEQPCKIQDWRVVPGIGAVAETIWPLEAQTADSELNGESAVLLAPGEARLLRVGQEKPIKSRLTSRKRLIAAAKSSRIIIENITPLAQDFQSAKHIVGDAIRVEADILCDGHQWLGVELHWRASDETTWHRQKMNFVGTERWSGTFFLSRLGAYEFVVEAWIDRYGYLQKELLDKVEARVDLAPYIAKGKAALEVAGRLSPGPAAAALHDALATFDELGEEQQISLLLDPAIADHVAAAGDKPFYARSDVRHVEAERTAAAFGNWYEMPFVPDNERLAEAVRQLPKIRTLGFDILCVTLPHFGTPKDNGSGDLAAWQNLFASAKQYGLEIAVEFPLRDAEKSDEAASAIDGPDLPRWTRLRDALLEWSVAGLNIFRMRDPRDMPFAFWQWVIPDLKRRNPAAIFVAGPVTSEKIAFRLPKEGFSQSLTTLPWPMSKSDAANYFSAFQADSQREIFRPHFRVDLPRGNNVVEWSGADFLAQCALAATLSGSWSIARALDDMIFSGDDPAKPAYAKALARLNWLRESNPALKSHRGLSFYNAYDERVFYYGRSMPERDDIILIAVNMSPRITVETEFEIPLWEWGLPDHASVDVEDLFVERRFIWRGKIQRAKFEPQRLPFAIWRIQPHR